MKTLLAMIICLAMALGGGTPLPETAQTATRWTLRDMVVVDGEEEIPVEATFALTGALGTGGGTLHFEAERDGKALLPISAALTPDALRFAFGTHELAYEIPDAALAGLLGMSAEEFVAEVLPLRMLAGLFTGYPGAGFTGEPAGRALHEVLGDEAEAVEVELDGETLRGERRSYRLTEAELPALLDALRTCGEPNTEALMEACLDTMGGEHTSFAEAVAARPEDAFTVSMDIIEAESEGVQYALVETEQPLSGSDVVSSRLEVVRRGEETELHIRSTMNDGSLDYIIQFTGPRDAPERAHAEYDLKSGGDALGFTLDCAREGGLYSVNISAQFYGEAFELSWAERAGDEGKSCRDVALTLSNGRTLRFTLEREDVAAEDDFAGMESLALTPEALNDSAPDDMYLYAALSADALRLNLDLTKLEQDPGLSALFAPPEVEAEPGIRRVETPEEAGAILQGEMPKYAPPEGFSLDGIDVTPDYVWLYYSSAQFDFCLFYFVPGDVPTERRYAISDGELIPEEYCIAEMHMGADGSIPSAVNVYEPNGGKLCFYFTSGDEIYNPTLQEVQAVLAGLQ